MKDFIKEEQRIALFNGKDILITGGTGSFGKKCTEIILKRYEPRRLIIFSRDELKQYEMAHIFSEKQYPCMRYFLGDVRDKDRLYRAFDGVDYIIHAAALKQVPAAEYNPFEAVKTNILGAENIIEAAIDQGVKRVIALSTDKAVNPVNLYGATKLCSEKLFIAGNAYVGSRHHTIFSVVRYGNVLGSRGSVMPLFMKQKPTGTITITDPRMTRFWITLQQAVEFVLRCFEKMTGGEIFIPKIPSMNIMDLAKAIAPDCEIKFIGIRSGEKIRETLISSDEARNTFEYRDYYLIRPDFSYWAKELDGKDVTSVSEGFEYSSDTNTWKLSLEELKAITKTL